MQLVTLDLAHFRSYTKKRFTFSRNTTVFVGPNAIGKTNILESIFVVSLGKSFRAQADREMIQIGEEIGRIKSQISNLPAGEAGLNDQITLEINITHGELLSQKVPIKRYLINGIAKKMIDFVGNLKVVLFWPEDLELVTDSPSRRRRYLDFVLVQVDREYRRSLASYEKGVRQRNRVLEKIREDVATRSQLMFWDQLVIKTGTYLSETRQRYVDEINNSRGTPFGDFKIIYDHSFITPARLAQYETEEVAAAVTLVGPHRDDLQFFEGNRNLSRFGSRGEQRLTVLWLKLAELYYIEKATGQRPLLLLDDIFSELDHQHRDEVVKIVEKQQTIITATDVHLLPQDLVKQAEVVELG